MGFSLGLSGSSSSSKTKTNNTLDPWSQAQIEGLLGPAKNILSGASMTPYTGQLGAGLDPAQIAAQSAAQANMGTGQSAISSAMQAAQAAGGYTPQNVQAGTLKGADIGAYMNPYVKNVAGNVLSDLDRARQMSITGTQGDFTKAGAFGGSRHGVADSLTNGEFSRTAASALDNLYSSAFNNAQQGAQFDIGSNLQSQLANQNAGLAGNAQGLTAAGLLGQLGQTQNQMGANDALLLNSFGTQAQQTQQNANDLNYGEFQRQQQYPFQQIAGYSSLLGGVPALVDSQGKSSGSSFGATAGVSYPSDRRLKQDIEPLGSMHGYDWYRYAYNDEGKARGGADGWHIGVMAQEVEQIKPEAVSYDADGYRYVNYGDL